MRQQHGFARRLARAFSLVEVVLALGVMAVSVVAILGVLPAGLRSSHSAQDETRAAQMAQAVLASIASGASVNFMSVTVPGMTGTLNLTNSETKPLYADNNGVFKSTAGGAIYVINIITNNAPTGFDSGYANEVKVQVAWPSTAAVQNQTKREYVRIISKY
jgi:uncharacterized protein (TIGR02598 family)